MLAQPEIVFTTGPPRDDIYNWTLGVGVFYIDHLDLVSHAYYFHHFDISCILSQFSSSN